MSFDLPDISFEECERCFAFLKTSSGEEFLQSCYENREREKRNCKPTSTQRKLLKLNQTRKHPEWEAHKQEIFFYYMRNFSSARILREITARGNRFSSQSPRTCDNRLEAWGYPLNPDFRKVFMSRLRIAAAAWETQSQLERVRDPFQVVSQTVRPVTDDDDSIHFSQENTPLGIIDSPTLGATKGNSMTDKTKRRSHTTTIGLMPNDQIPPIDLSGISASNLEEPNAQYLAEYLHSELDSELDSLMSYEPMSLLTNEEEASIQIDYVDPSLLTKPASILKPDTDSGYYSMEVPKATSYEEMEFGDNIQEEPSSGEARSESPDMAYYELFDANSLIPSNRMSSYLRQELEAQRSPSILHKIPCKNDHMDIAFGKRTVCACGITQIHAICICMMDLPDHQVLTILGHVLEKDVIDGAGNTPLHYIAASGRKELLDYMLRLGVDHRRLNVIGQSFLHVLDASRFSDDLINFLEPFKESELLDQRDHDGRTVLHGLLRHPILPHVYYDLVDFYGVERAIHFALRDNQGIDAAQHIRVVDQAQNPHASYGSVGYAQAIVVYENIANRFIADTVLSDNSVQEMQNRLAVLRHSNPNVAKSNPNVQDCNGRNALHCLVSAPRACSLEDSETRVSQLKQYIFSGTDINHYDQAGRTPLLASIIDSTSTANESVMKITVELLCQSGANVHQRDRDGHTALFHAIRQGFCDCVAILLQHGAHVNRRTPNGRSYRGLAQDILQEHLTANDQEGFDNLQKRLAVVSAIITYRAELEPTKLQAWGVDAT